MKEIKENEVFEFRSIAGGISKSKIVWNSERRGGFILIVDVVE